MAIFMACGTNFAFGVFQELYQSMSLEPSNPFTGASPAEIDLIGTLSVAFMTIAAPFSTAWTKRFSPRLVIVLGGGLFFLACLLASFSERLWQFQLTQGLLLGLGTCFAYMPAVTVAPTWYGPRRGLALGIILAGTGVGGLVWAPVIRALNATVGYRNALRISGGLCGGLISLSAGVMKWDSVTRARLEVENQAGPKTLWGRLFSIPLIDWRVAKTRLFTGQLLGAAFQSAAYYTPVFFFSAYARTLGYSAASGANFIAINNACNAAGKVIIGSVADRYGRVNTLLATTLISAVASFAFWLPSALDQSQGVSRGLFIVYAIAYGTFASAYVSLFPTSLVEVFGPAQFASVNGVLYMARGLATLVGTPVAGLLIRDSMVSSTLPSAYWRTTVLVGSLLAGASVAVSWVRIETKGRSAS